MKHILEVRGREGFEVSFPYSPQAVEQIHQVLGLAWDKEYKVWYSRGPEVLLDLQRLRIETWASPKARVRAKEFFSQLDQVLNIKAQANGQEQYGFQKAGTAILSVQGKGILADEMGLGKSKQALEACRGRVLIVAPKTLLWNWEQEVQKWRPDLPTHIVPDNPRLRLSWPTEAMVIITNYEKVCARGWDSNYNWDTLILDEVQRAKNTRTLTHKNLRRIVACSEQVFALSGTPLEMRVEELYGVMSLIRPAVFGNFGRFRDQHIRMDHWGTIVGSKNHQLLRERIAPWLTRRTKAEVANQLPPKIFNVVNPVLKPEEEQVYKEMKDRFILWLHQQQRSPSEANLLTQLLRLQQFTSSPQLLGYEAWRGAKFEALLELLAEWEGQALIFTRFKEMALLLVEWLGAQAVIHGDVPAKDRLGLINDFNEGKAGKYLISTDAGAYGLNITGANLVVHYDLLWNPAKMHQREDRAHRLGQKNVVNVVTLATKGTVDEGMLKVLQRRERLFHDVIERAEETLLQKLTQKDMEDLV